MAKKKKTREPRREDVEAFPEHIETLYKLEPPYSKVKKEDGYGYYGVVLWDRNEDKIQCHICGKWKIHLPAHIFKAHGVSNKEYRITYGLTMTTPLVSRGFSKKMREATIKRREKGEFGTTSEQMKKLAKKRGRGWKLKHRAGTKYAWNNALFENKRGICFEQLKRRYSIVCEMVGKSFASEREMRKHDPKAFYAISARHGGLNNFRAKAKLALHRRHIVYTEDVLIAAMRKKAAEIRRLPICGDFKKGRPSHNDYYRVFGSWNRARAIAFGLDERR